MCCEKKTTVISQFPRKNAISAGYRSGLSRGKTQLRFIHGITKTPFLYAIITITNYYVIKY